MREEFLVPMGILINALARALRLARYFGCSAELWLGLQQDYELDAARDEAGERIAIEVLPRAS